jgi:hypothetical protein
VLKSMSHNWSVKYSRKAEDQFRKLKRSGTKPSIVDVINLLVVEIVKYGPYRTNWHNYGPLGEDKFHCHLKKGRPTYVACWKILNKVNKEIEVYYVGTHENAPY